MTATPSVQELGTAGGVRRTLDRRGGDRYVSDPLEQSPELRFPQSVAVYDRMRTEDGHIGSIINAITLTASKANWQLTGDVDDEVMNKVRQDLAIPEPGQPRQRTSGVSWHSHVTEAAEASLWAGFMCFEQVYSVDPDNGEVTLRKLAPRLPRSIGKVEVDRNGGLKAVHQKPSEWSTEKELVPIPVEKLVMYVNRKEGADWTGRSILRTAYKHWLIKDLLVRMDAQIAERNGMGLPVIKYPSDDGNNKLLAEEIIASVRAGETAGITLPAGWEFTIQGTSGSTVDLVSRMRYHDQEMARASLAMFLDVTSNESGSRALVEPVLDVFLDSVQAFADNLAETGTEHIIRDLVEYNFGPGTAYPSLTPGDIKASRGIGVEALQRLVDMEVVIPDDNLEKAQREQYGMPAPEPDKRRYTRYAATSIAALHRAGFKPDAASQGVGVPAIGHTGLSSVSVQSPGLQSHDNSAVQQQATAADDKALHEAVGLTQADGSGTPVIPGMEDLVKVLTENAEARRRWYAKNEDEQTSE